MSKTHQNPGKRPHQQSSEKSAKVSDQVQSISTTTATLPPLDPSSTPVHSEPAGRPPVQMARVKGITPEQLEEARNFKKHADGHLVAKHDSNQTRAMNAAWNDQHHDVAAVNAQLKSVGAKLDNRKARAEQAKKDQAKRSSRWYKLKKAGYKGGMKAVGGIGGAATGALAGAPLGPGALGTAVLGGAIGGGLAGAAAGMTWNTGEKGTDLVASGRERELASASGRMGRNGKSTQKAAAVETGKDALMGTVTGALSPLIGVAGDAAGAAAGEGGGAVAAEAFSSSAMSATSKEAADLAYDKATGTQGPSLRQRGANILTGTLIGAATGGADESDASAVANNQAGLSFENDLHQWQGQGGEAASDLAYGAGGETLGGGAELGGGQAAVHAPTSKSLHDVVRKTRIEKTKKDATEMMKGKATKAREVVRKREEARKEAERKREEERHHALLPQGRHNVGYH